MTTRPTALTPVSEDSSDEDLIAQLAGGQQEALGPLYSRYASLIFNIAAHTLDRTAAEDLVQEVFLTVWRNATAFDPERGPLRPWVLQIAHFRIVNELRRQSRRPRIEPDPDGLRLAALSDSAPGVEELAWQSYERGALRSAIDSLPLPQRQAVSLAFFKELTHDQVASELDLPLGTAKTRIRTGIQRLRVSLAPLGVAALLVGALGYIGLRYRDSQAIISRYDVALTVVTSSDTHALRLSALPGISQATHAMYRSEPGVATVVVTMEHFNAAPAGKTYQIWAHVKGAWVSVGTFNPDRAGSSRMIAQDPILATPPDALEITLEPAGGSHAPSGSPVVAWPGQP